MSKRKRYFFYVRVRVVVGGLVWDQGRNSICFSIISARVGFCCTLCTFLSIPQVSERSPFLFVLETVPRNVERDGDCGEEHWHPVDERLPQLPPPLRLLPHLRPLPRLAGWAECGAAPAVVVQDLVGDAVLHECSTVRLWILFPKSSLFL